MCEHLTCVQIAFYPEFANYWLRFGEPDQWLDLDRRRAMAFFAPGRVFGYVRWRANEFGTQDWRFTIIQAMAPAVLLSRIEGVDPGGQVLVLTTGKAKVKRLLAQIDVLEAAGFEPPEVSPDYYHHVHNRIATSRPVAPYSEGQHAAFLAAKAVTP
ncbi:MAG: DUF2840 domain-containing protein [Kiloniellales bacterium]|nr:DUF2840 domain-containing protein [Kiloniellales bacterium]